MKKKHYRDPVEELILTIFLPIAGFGMVVGGAFVSVIWLLVSLFN